MKSTLFSLRAIVTAVLLAAALTAHADDVYVVANAALQLSPEEVKEIFLGEVQFTGSTKLLPVDNAGAQADFLARVLKMSGPKYQAAWTKKAFRDGLNAPPLKASDAEVIAFVKGNRGAIGYVNSVPTGVNVIGRY
jgi:hypothetical protein